MAKKKTVLSVLMAARKLLSERKRWTKDADAKNAKKEEVDACSAEAVCWCARGAVLKCAGRAWMKKNSALSKLREIIEDNRSCAVTNYNDEAGRTHKSILSWFDRAIERAKAST